MKIYKITEASEYLGMSINTLKTLANNGKINSFKTSGQHRRFRQEDLDAYMGGLVNKFKYPITYAALACVVVCVIWFKIALTIKMAEALGMG